MGFFTNKLSLYNNVVAGPDIPFRVCVCGGGGGGAHVMRFNAKVTIGSFEGRKLIYNKIISRYIISLIYFQCDEVTEDCQEYDELQYIYQ